MIRVSLVQWIKKTHKKWREKLPNLKRNECRKERRVVIMAMKEGQELERRTEYEEGCRRKVSFAELEKKTASANQTFHPPAGASWQHDGPPRPAFEGSLATECWWYFCVEVSWSRETSIVL